MRTTKREWSKKWQQVPWLGEELQEGLPQKWHRPRHSCSCPLLFTGHQQGAECGVEQLATRTGLASTQDADITGSSLIWSAFMYLFLNLFICKSYREKDREPLLLELFDSELFSKDSIFSFPVIIIFLEFSISFG